MMGRTGMSTIIRMAMTIIMGMGMIIIAMDMSHTRMAIIIAMTMIKPAVTTTKAVPGHIEA